MILIPVETLINLNVAFIVSARCGGSLSRARSPPAPPSIDKMVLQCNVSSQPLPTNCYVGIPPQPPFQLLNPAHHLTVSCYAR